MSNNVLTYGMAARLSAALTAGLFIFFVLVSFYFRSLFDLDDSLDPHLTGQVLLGTAMQFVLQFCLFCINFRVLSGEGSPRRKTLVCIGASVLFAVVFSVGLSMLQGVTIPGGMPGPNEVFVVAGGGRDLFLAAFVIFIANIMYLNQTRRQMERRNDQLEAENLRTRYEALKNQVNPHFLFNTLSTLDAMVGVDSARAREYIQKFSSVFRYTLRNNDTVSLADELAFVRDYAEMMQIRHGVGLRVEMAVDPGLMERWVVPMAVQGLVENAIKHNSFSESEPLVITVATTPDERLRVSNPFRPREYPEPGEGVGLANLAGRYRLDGREITIANQGGVFCVSIPLIPPQP